jgi:hypothetical protein
MRASRSWSSASPRCPESRHESHEVMRAWCNGVCSFGYFPTNPQLCSFSINSQCLVWYPLTLHLLGLSRGCASVLLQVCQLVTSSRNPPRNSQDIFIQADNVRLRKDQIEVLQRLRRPEALHAVEQLRCLRSDIYYARVRNIRPRRCIDGGEHLPSAVLQCLVASNTV